LSQYWNKDCECISTDQLRSLQDERLKATVKHVYQEVPYYRHAFQENGIEPGDIKTVDDLKQLPFTTKNDLRDNYPYGLFAVPLCDVVRLHASSGTTAIL
jgi:phenylacetate-CoA ligase